MSHDAKKALRTGIGVLTLTIGLFGQSPSGSHAAQQTNADDYRNEPAAIAEVLAPSKVGAIAAVTRARMRSTFVSTLTSGDLNARLAGVLQWVVRDYANSGRLRLLSAAPEGKNNIGATNSRLHTLQHTYWLQDNALYGTGALLEYQPVLGRNLSSSWRAKWQQYFAAFCPDTESDVVIGLEPSYELDRQPVDPRCRLERPGTWQYLRMSQYPSPSDADFDNLPLPIIGTDYPADKVMHAKFVPIKNDSVRDLLKYGCLRQVVLGNPAEAKQMFDLALEQWNGVGFAEAKSRDDTTGRLSQTYWTRDLVFALMCANALDLGGAQIWGDSKKVSKASMEQSLWNIQSSTGGIWTNYCTNIDSGDCGHTGIPTIAKQTNEIAPLVLLAYGPNIWAHPRAPTP